MLLLLGGTAEARMIADALAERGTPAIASFAHPARDCPLPMVAGGFGGAEGFAAFLSARGITAVLDATHPFAAHISQRTADICAAQGLPHAMVLRPPWVPGPGDRWTFITQEQEAAAHIAPHETVFLATGRQTLAQFAGLAGRRVYCRLLGPAKGAFPFDGGAFITGTAPFSVADELALFRRLGVDWLVVKNAGGTTPTSKLTAARQLGIRVLMQNRPPPPATLTFESVDAALTWMAGL